ncbi:MAG TPA: hypothetical protein PLI53_12545, partial [Geobacteraceae bacterium]|nr:hypothetical protein [Geobacteraceae bacterium]
LQTGRPEHIFNCPRPGFVAEFLGARNILHGTVRSHDASSLTHIAVGETALYSTDPAPIDHRVQLSVRPEELAIARKQVSITLRNQVPVKIESLERRGPLVWITGTADGFSLEAAVTVSGAREQDLKIEDEAVFAFSANSLRIISPENEPSLNERETLPAEPLPTWEGFAGT